MSSIDALKDELHKLTLYSRLPNRLAEMYPDVAAAQKEDLTGILDRLEAIKLILRDRDLGNIIDLGGNSGYFSLSLIDAGMATKAVVYDKAAAALSAGRLMAEQMGISHKIDYVEQKIDFDFLQRLPPVDTMLCLYFLHHAGTLFDIVRVEALGWEKYAEGWLAEMRRKCRLAIVAVGFKGGRPQMDVPPRQRPAQFAQLAKKVGWSILYEANVEDIRLLGVEAANGNYVARSPERIERVKTRIFKKVHKFHKRIKSKIAFVLNLSQEIHHTKNNRDVYQLYILESGGRAKVEAAQDAAIHRPPRLRSIKHLLVVAAPTGSGKSTFVKKMKKGDLTDDVLKRMPTGVAAWPCVKAGDFEAILQSAHAEDLKNEIQGVVLDYDITRSIARSEGYSSDPVMILLRLAQNTTILTLRPSIDQTMHQLIRRDAGARTKNIKLGEFIWRCARVGRWTLLTLASALPQGVATRLKVLRPVTGIWNLVNVPRTLSTKLARFQRVGWTDEIHERWKAYLRSLAAEGARIEEIDLEPDTAGSTAEDSYQWRIATDDQR